jgi:hypothetical protein
VNEPAQHTCNATSAPVSLSCTPRVSQLDVASFPSGEPALLAQVIDTGPGLKGVNYRTLFDPSAEFGTIP